MLNAKIQLGSIQFINSLPVDLGMIQGHVPVDADIIQDVPAVLNERLLQGTLDLSPVSSFFYAQHKEELVLCQDISISSESSVQSVLLFSRGKWSDLKNKTIWITGKGRTTPVLLEILCRKRDGFIPRLQVWEGLATELPADAEAVLLIGDEALLLSDHFISKGYQSMDLAEEWTALTGLPFVFAVWVARKDTMNEPLLQVYQKVLESKAWGLAHKEEIILEAIRRTGLPRQVLESYFSKLSYDFNDRLKKGMRRFFDLAESYGFLQGFKSPELQGQANYSRI